MQTGKKPETKQDMSNTTGSTILYLHVCFITQPSIKKIVFIINMASK